MVIGGVFVMKPRSVLITIRKILLFSLLGMVLAWSHMAEASNTTIQSGGVTASFGNTRISLNISNGDYEIGCSTPAWTFAGSIGSPVSHFAPVTGEDNLGSYFQCSFDFTSAGQKAHGIMRVYKNSNVAMVGVQGGDVALAFPDFKSMPNGLHLLTFQNAVHSPPSFTQQTGSMPWVLFDDQYDTVVISPASEFMLSNLVDDNNKQVATELNPGSDVPKSSETRWTILTFGHGIQNTLMQWGQSLDAFCGAQRPGNESNVILRDFGYWTDNGAYYYYNYDPKLGYTGTLLAVGDEFKKNNVPLGYMELDSWWYSKTYTFVDGKQQKPKNSNIPAQDWNRNAVADWNRYGGTWEYRATPELFPSGLADFDRKLGVPLVVHARWIDPKSPYHEQYTISGVAPTDPAWWQSTAAYLADSGVISYEQDWLNYIYQYSPRLQTSPDTANHFTGGMSSSMSARNISLIYCMVLPRLFLQGSTSTEVSIIRCSGDRFEPHKWQDFLYTSSLASALGIWPWTDTFFSRETPNILLSTLSAGPVGVGDPMGGESWDNIRKVIRSDGRIIKPDMPLRPLDQTILADAQKMHQPFLAATYSDQGLKTVYLFAWRRMGDGKSATATLWDLGLPDGKYIAYDYMNQKVHTMDQNHPLQLELAPNQWQYDVIVPVTGAGIGIVGDLDSFVPMGRQRISEASADINSVDLKVIFAQGEKSLRLTYYAGSQIDVSSPDADITDVYRDASSGLYTFTLQPKAGLPEKSDFDKTIRVASITLISRPAQ
jgi:hypothetical protein